MNEEAQHETVYDVERRLQERFYALKQRYPKCELSEAIQCRISGLTQFIDKEELGRLELAFTRDEEIDAMIHGDTLRRYTMEFAKRLDDIETMIAQIKKEQGGN